MEYRRVPWYQCPVTSDFESAATGKPRPDILVLSRTNSGVSRVARPLRARGCAVQSCGDLQTAENLVKGHEYDLLVVERHQGDRQALDFLLQVRASSAMPTVLIGPLSEQTLAWAINEAQVTRVISANEDLPSTLNGILETAKKAMGEPSEQRALKTRCQMLEGKIDRLVRDSVQREGASQLLHDLLVEIGHASGLKEVAARCLARVVTMLRLDMAFIVLSPKWSDKSAGFHSFGCPRDILVQLHELPWSELMSNQGDDEKPFAVLQVLEGPHASRLARAMQIEAVKNLVVFPLRVQQRALGYLGVGSKKWAAGEKSRWNQLTPIVKQIAIAIENSRLVEAASSSQNLAEGVIKHLPLTVLVCDRRGTVLKSSDSKQNIFDGRAIAGANLAALLSPMEADALIQPLSAVARGGDPMYLRALRLRLNGHERLLNASIAALPEHQVLLILDDVTRRESVAGDLRRARALTSSLFAHAPAGVLFLRQSGEIVDVNSTACKIFHLPRTALLGKNLEDLFFDLWRATQLETADGPSELTFRLTDGQQATVSMATTRLGRQGRPAGILLQIQDKGELEALRAELRRRDNLALMGQMVSFIAHEIKNPLFGVSSAAQVLARETNPEEAERLSSAMLSEIDRLSQLLEELLVFGSKREIQPELGDPVDLCRDIATIHQEALLGKKIAFHVELESPQKLISFDTARLRQVVINLMNNAIEATQEDGQISLTCCEQGAEYLIAVTNSGEPIPPEDNERIFDLFYSTKPRGSGLGLAICRKIVEDHGGRLVLTSSMEVGTRLCVFLPLS